MGRRRCPAAHIRAGGLAALVSSTVGEAGARGQQGGCLVLQRCSVSLCSSALRGGGRGVVAMRVCRAGVSNPLNMPPRWPCLVRTKGGAGRHGHTCMLRAHSALAPTHARTQPTQAERTHHARERTRMQTNTHGTRSHPAQTRTREAHRCTHSHRVCSSPLQILCPALPSNPNLSSPALPSPLRRHRRLFSCLGPTQ